ncbi:Polysulphide reductase, NrfD [Micromonospora pattaloongensis]|uniref:Polysulphide reductase, NrfD n=1 Tax=Micromonospora pattaloongensis TaxID=405436 RepID=A0A1H3NXX2_9ACTN|nr:NrfD/PsrC family molybdoenzyme membrane anchor subunit [Micromonospora pattaloongensis]SDY93039.1 Polysulphide reductase, NrfD [Micromonospora pattaloongensis]
MSDGDAMGERFREFQRQLAERGDPAGPAAGQPASRTERGVREPGSRDWAPQTQRARPGDRGRRNREAINVPPAEFSSYYGRPILKPPVWKHDIAAYLFTGGLAAGSSLIAAGADLTGRPTLRRAARITSLGAVVASTYFLINDLGKPARFHHMLRVAKPTSPMSIGTWILSAFGPAAGVAAVAELGPLLPERGVLGLARRVSSPAGRIAGLAAAATAPALATYTGVLLADTAVPSWHDAYPDLPFLFAGSALVGASGAALIAAPPTETGPVHRLAVAGAAMELVAERRIEHGMGLSSEPYQQGLGGRLTRLSRALLLGGVAGALVGRRSRLLSMLSGAALVGSSLATRFGVFHAGVDSAKDPKYTVVPQRERLERKGSAPGA